MSPHSWNDLSILYFDADETAAAQLLVELRLMGARATRQQVNDLSAVPDLIAELRTHHSALLLIVGEAFARELEQGDLELRGLPPEVVPLAFGVKADLRRKVEARFDDLVTTRSRSASGLSAEVLRAVMDRAIPLKPARSLEEHWESSLSLYRKQVGFKGSREVLVDVTWSAKPIQSEPAEMVLRLFGDVIDYLGDGDYKILDFGAGKLRYSLFWLGQGQQVTAVEYPEPFERPTEEIRDALNRAAGNQAFDRLVYPTHLVGMDQDHFDLALLINVISIVPDPLERLFIVSQCHEKLKPGGHLIWFHYYGDLSQKKAASDQVTDGGCTTQKGRKTFYKNLPKEEAVRLGRAMGFDLVDGPTFQVDKNVACLFRKARQPVGDVKALAQTRRDLLERKVLLGASESERVIVDVLDADRYLRFGDFLAHSLHAIEPGDKGAHRYEALIERIIEYVFRNHFNGPELTQQYQLSQGRQRADLKATWRKDSALKTLLVDDYGLSSSWVPIECKSYSGPLGNDEYSQIVERCHRRFRHFGMIYCRDLMDRDKVLAHCADRLKKHDYLLVVFDDADVTKLLGLADREQALRDRDQPPEADQVVEYVRKRMEQVADR